MKYSTVLDRVARDRADHDGPVVGTLQKVASLVGSRDTPLLQLRVLDRMRPFLRHMVCQALAEHFPDATRITPRSGHDPKIYADFMRLAHSLGIVIQRNGRYEASPGYARGTTWAPPPEDARAYHVALGWIDDLGREGSSFQRDDTRYLVTMLHYLRELERIDFSQQIPGSHEPSFYSDLGRLAYELYTEDRFKKVVSSIPVEKFADIGCGEGLQLLGALDVHPESAAVGYEINPAVAEALANRTALSHRIEIRNLDARDSTETSEYDMVLAIYMLFYLPEDQRLALLQRMWQMLKPGGKLVVGQYFPDAPDIQRATMTGAVRVRPLRPYMTSLSRVILDAEIVVNRIVEDFSSVVYWDDFTDQLQSAGFRIERVIPADNMYYSFFIVCERDVPSGAPR